MGKKSKRSADSTQNGQASKESEPIAPKVSPLDDSLEEDTATEASGDSPIVTSGEDNAANETSTQELVTVTAKLKELQLKLTQKDGQIDSLKEASLTAGEELNSKLTALKKEHDKTLSELTVANDSISRASEAQSNGLKKLEEENSALRHEVAEAKRNGQQVEELKIQLATAVKAKQDSDHQYQNLLGRIGSIKSTLGERFKTDAAELARCREQVKDLEGQSKSLTESVETLKRELITSSRENDGLSQQLSAIRSEYQNSIGQWEHKQDKLTRENRSAREEAENNQSLAQRLEVSLLEERTLRISLGSKISDMEEQIASQTNYAEQYRSERDEAKVIADRLSDKLQSETKATMETINSLSEQLERVKEQLDQVQKSYAREQARVVELEKSTSSINQLEREAKEKNLQLGKARHEAVILNEHLKKALRVIQQNSEGNTVDKRLVTNMLLSFLSLPRADTKRFEVLQLISNYLGWDDDQNIQAGLRSSVSNSAVLSGLRSPLSPASRTFSYSEGGGGTGSVGFISKIADFLDRESTRSSPNGK